ncbi:hypothetical protein L596_030915 [Steinernema carpocapsae]|uniref:Uncharacterized protein n=1 Tax=Steinernema carpocapsae TaxID=34508 RepID=A0A4U5MH88_STECR|nr:hypothetical protein L596_030915 [Steinernema carpocapsae]
MMAKKALRLIIQASLFCAIIALQVYIFKASPRTSFLLSICSTTLFLLTLSHIFFTYSKDDDENLHVANSHNSRLIVFKIQGAAIATLILLGTIFCPTYSWISFYLAGFLAWRIQSMILEACSLYKRIPEVIISKSMFAFPGEVKVTEV